MMMVTNHGSRRVASAACACLGACALGQAFVPRAYAADLLEGVMGLLGGAMSFGGAILLGLGLIMLAVQLRFDSACGSQLMAAIGMMILGVLMIAFKGLVGYAG